MNLRSEEMCLVAVRQHAGAMQYVPVRLRNDVKTALEQETAAFTESEVAEPETDAPRP